MQIDLSGRIALVTGSTAGIGLAIAKGLHASGAEVVLNGRTEERLEKAVTEFDDTARVRTIAANVGSAEGCSVLTEEIPEVDILVNNAGIFAPQPLFEIEDGEWQRFFDVNVMSGIRLSRHYVPAMVRRGWGRTVFISSESAVQVPPEMVHYGMTKTAQLTVARGLAEAVGGSGVTVNSILPGPTLSEGVEKFVQEVVGDEASSMEEASRLFIEKERPTSLLGRLASSEEVANLAVYLCSDQASATTGAALRADGGVLRGVL
ncbi:SDR family NAD(P)-dependent oxidoreductase [Streptomyces luteolus]|uniref:SDR family oxidoreductase n=1 Tax=Streptomyces luteolus TaxID=3043615 RepID=A0ABT6T0V3_9ACTN|nr:SDR family oxidoreductase [Streptomyces sp. B-S-A12]MDI3420729.1 SDR family oxidoreductase [Streptomyces sp. B-S-A12]